MVCTFLAAEGEDGSSGSQFLDLGCPESEGFSSSSSEQYEHNVESVALNVMEQDQSGEKRSLFLEDWELATVALSRHIALDMLCQEMHEAWSLGSCCQEACCLSKKAFLSPWTGCDHKGEGMW